MLLSTCFYYVIVLCAVLLGGGMGLGEPVSFLLVVGSGVYWYVLHEQLVDEGRADIATLFVLLQGSGLVIVMALLMGWPWFCAAGACPLMVIGLRKLRQRMPWGRSHAHP